MNKSLLFFYLVIMNHIRIHDNARKYCDAARIT